MSTAKPKNGAQTKKLVIKPLKRELAGLPALG
jgi:hypothetical protein